MTALRCASCKWWSRAGSPLSAALRHGYPHDDVGTCQIGPPLLFERADSVVGIWPETAAERFCSEWAPGSDGDGPDGGEEQVAVHLALLGREP